MLNLSHHNYTDEPFNINGYYINYIFNSISAKKNWPNIKNQPTSILFSFTSIKVVDENFDFVKITKPIKLLTIEDIYNEVIISFPNDINQYIINHSAQIHEKFKDSLLHKSSFLNSVKSKLINYIKYKHKYNIKTTLVSPENWPVIAATLLFE